MPNWTSNTLTIVSKDMDLLTKIEHEITSVEKDELNGRHLFLLLRKFRGNTILKSFFFQTMKEGRNQQK